MKMLWKIVLLLIFISCGINKKEAEESEEVYLIPHHAEVGFHSDVSMTAYRKNGELVIGEWELQEKFIVGYISKEWNGFYLTVNNSSRLIGKKKRTYNDSITDAMVVTVWTYPDLYTGRLTTWYWLDYTNDTLVDVLCKTWKVDQVDSLKYITMRNLTKGFYYGKDD